VTPWTDLGQRNQARLQRSQDSGVTLAVGRQSLQMVITAGRRHLAIGDGRVDDSLIGFADLLSAGLLAGREPAS
jgi:hypothetical protein